MALQFNAMSPHRLRRLDWLFRESVIFFITACTESRRQLLANPDVQRAFEEFSRRAAERGIFIDRYVLMPDHLHFFAGFVPQAAPLAIWMKSLKNSLSKTLRSQGVESPHWQKGFFDHILRSRESYAQKWAYVQLNPVRARLVSRTQDWPFQGEIARLAL